jgi:hypothetical protein
LAAVFAVALAWMAADRAAARAELGLSRGSTLVQSCAELAKGQIPPEVGHLVLTGCALDVPAATVVFDGPDLIAAYVPLVLDGRPTLHELPVLYRSEDPLLMAHLTEFIRSEPPDPTAWLAEQIDASVDKIDGTVLRGRGESVEDAEQLERHSGHLPAGAVVLADRARQPSPVAPAAGAFLLALLAMWGLWFPPPGIVAGMGTRTEAPLSS